MCTGTGTVVCTGTGTVVCTGTGIYDVCTSTGTVTYWILFNTMRVWKERNYYFCVIAEL